LPTRLLYSLELHRGIKDIGFVGASLRGDRGAGRVPKRAVERLVIAAPAFARRTPSAGRSGSSRTARRTCAPPLWIGNGDSVVLHNAGYDFDDDAISIGASFSARLVETALPGQRALSASPLRLEMRVEPIE
jgi:hippurate hydrolase